MGDQMTGSDALSAWAEQGFHRVMLPSGQWAKVRLPDTQIFLRAGRLPDDVRKIALQFATTGVDPSKIGEEEVGPFIRFQYALAATTLRALAPIGADLEDPNVWITMRATGDELQDSEIPQEDLHALLRIANRTQSPAQVSYGSIVDSGLRDVLAPDVVKAMEAARHRTGQTLPEYADFRGERSGDPDGADGGAVRAAAERDDGDRRPADRVRRGRSSRS